jgi:hypothetical protein
MADTSSSKFRDKIADLQREITKLEAKVNASDANPQTKILMIVAGVMPVIIFLALYYGSPGFVTSKHEKTKKTTTSLWKVGMWTSIFTLVVWLALYGYTYTSMYSSA